METEGKRRKDEVDAYVSGVIQQEKTEHSSWCSWGASGRESVALKDQIRIVIRLMMDSCWLYVLDNKVRAAAPQIGGFIMRSLPSKQDAVEARNEERPQPSKAQARPRRENQPNTAKPRHRLQAIEAAPLTMPSFNGMIGRHGSVQVTKGLVLSSS